jgi:16S rRNA (guanine527-N7)-methyltransferase
MKQKIQKIFSEYKIELEENEINKFEQFLEIFISKNSKINLSAIRKSEDIILKHFLDSIILNIFIEFDENSKILDL